MIKAGVPVRITLLGDGSSDRVLLPILSWLIRDIAGPIPLDSQWADSGQLGNNPSDRIRRAVELFPCQLLFIHRDAERQEALDDRLDEIERMCHGFPVIAPGVTRVSVVPVRMTEAWLLFDEAAIRRAAGNPLGTEPLGLPPVRKLEQVHAKEVLHKALRDASGTTGRRLKKLNIHRSLHVITDWIADYSPLDALPGFARLRNELREALYKMELVRGD